MFLKTADTFLSTRLFEIATVMTYRCYFRQLKNGNYLEDIWKMDHVSEDTSGIQFSTLVFFEFFTSHVL